ncbi:phage integrase [Pseudomonas sp. MT-1]|uniref:tyrosine-type recombinase/integrase n=1 Tax=Stutzerimonas stutzeri TaxID=316 RepID=UPI000536233F|nr:site-specific integrase [Stutzerimonas stutzeri]MCQ4282897.1 integrase arm-type DNA-binding domain-containing protein [Stutzerimonas stutzeri]BAP80327.1 phage integrase [Pseudomonas sp. MT-1]|tara:strand:+ start:201 stop:1436 length:1236 start_codon:yes stop_codon:yes gene_type:complete
MGKLNPKQVENLSEPGTYEDGDGLRLVVKATGRKSWVMRYQLNGKRREMGLGGFPDIGLKAARQAAADQRKLLTAGADPMATRDAEREALRASQMVAAAKAVTFKKVATDYIAAHRAGWKNVKHAQQWENTLATYAEPVIGHLPAAEVSTAHVLEILQPIWITKTETASRVRNRIELILDAAKARGLRDGENPARWRGHLDKLLPKRAKVRAVEHHTALPWPDLPAFMDGLAKHDALSYAAIRLTILTACRTSEVLGATWDEVDLESHTWTIPAARMKAGKDHRVPLSDAALKVLGSLPRIDGSPYLFPGARQGRPLSNLAMLMGLRRMGRGNLTMHGFRSTFRDWAAERTQYPREVCEMALAHKIAEGAEAAYWRGDIFEKRRALMADWAKYATQAPVSKVVALRRAAHD